MDIELDQSICTSGCQTFYTTLENIWTKLGLNQDYARTKPRLNLEKAKNISTLPQCENH